MTRRHLTFLCEGSRLTGTLDDAAGGSALLLVSGGNEVRAGAWNGQARFAAAIAGHGYPVLRFDRRGVGDSEGENAGFRASAPDIAAACAALREAAPHVERIIGFGNCDAASALMLCGGAGLDGLVLSNPWTMDGEEDAAPAEVVRDHYRRRLADPAAIRRLLTGQVSLVKLARSLVGALRPSQPAPAGLAAEMAMAIAGFDGPIRFPVAGRDRTGLAFLSRWDRNDARLLICADASHSYVEPNAHEWLVQRTLEMLAR